MMMLAIAAVLTIQPDACYAVLDGDRILGRHLASADSRWANISPELFIGFAPSPGVKRVLPVEQLLRLLPGGDTDTRPAAALCLEWPMRELVAEDLVKAIRESLGKPDLPVEILGYSKSKIPPGRIEFERRGISSEEMIGSVGATWRGHVILGGKRRFSIWARVRIDYASEMLVATEDLQIGQSIRAGQLGTAVVRGLPAEPQLPAAQLVGMAVFRPIRAGLPVVLSDLRPPLIVAKGDTLQVTVQRGSVRFNAEVLADTSGRLGEWIQVRNSNSGKQFRAVVDGPGKVHVP